MKIDCHTHTKPRSPCSTLSPDELLTAAKEAGLDGVLLAEHETFWPEEYHRWLKKAFPGLLIFMGVETDVGSLGHVVVIPREADNSILNINSPEKLAEYIEKTGSYAFVAHPYRYYDDFEKRNRHFDLPAVEVASFNMHEHDSVKKSLEFARDNDAAPITASDAHSPDPVGEYYLVFESELETQKDLITALHRGEFQPEAPVLSRLESLYP